MKTYQHISLLGAWIFSISSHGKIPSCGKDVRCPPGLLQVQTKNSVCTGFLISPNIVATNQHCIPDEVRNNPETCSQKIKVSMIESSTYKDEVIPCHQLKAISSRLTGNLLGPDIAIFELEEKSERPPLKISSAGISNQEEVTIYKINPNKETNIGQAEKIQCKGVTQSILNLFYEDANSSIFTLYPCQMEPGNSGSPAINQAGEVVGIMNAISQTDELSQQYSYLKEIPKNISHGTNAKCLQDINSCQGSFDRNSADLKLKKYNADNNVLLKKKIRSEITSHLTELHKLSEKLFYWNVDSEATNEQEFKKNGIVARFNLKPHCVSLPFETIDKSAKVLKDRQIVKKYMSYTLTAYSKLDEYLRSKNEIEKKEVQLELTFNPKDLLKETFPVTIKNLTTNSEEKLNLPFCPLDKVKLIYE